MAANRKWSVRHRCGHRINWDLSHKPPERRVGFAAWLAMRDCTRCWWTKRRNPDRRSRAVLRPPRTDRRQTAQTVAEAESLPVLEGSARAVAWASRIRHDLLLAAQKRLGTGTGAEEEFAHRYADPARRITTAAWWIDHRRVTPGELRQILVSPPAGRAGDTREAHR